MDRRTFIRSAPLAGLALPKLVLDAGAEWVPDNDTATVTWFHPPAITEPLPPGTIQYSGGNRLHYGTDGGTVRINLDAIDPERLVPERVDLGDDESERYVFPVKVYYRHQQPDLEASCYMTPPDGKLACGCPKVECGWDCRCAICQSKLPGSNLGALINRRLVNTETGDYHPTSRHQTYLSDLVATPGEWPQRELAKTQGQADAWCYRFVAMSTLCPDPAWRVDWAERQRLTARYTRTIDQDRIA